MTEPTPRSSWQAGKGERLLAGIVALAATATALFLILSPPRDDSSAGGGNPSSAKSGGPPTFPVPKRSVKARNSGDVHDAHSATPARKTATRAVPATTRPTGQHAATNRPASKANPVPGHTARSTVANHPSPNRSHAPHHGYYVQTGAFRDLSRAQTLSRRLARTGWPVRIVDKRKGREHLHAVVIGPWATPGKAEAVRKKVTRRHHIQGFVIHL